jgi:cytochrome c553
MKKFFKWTGIVFGVLLVLLGAFALYLNFKPRPKFDTPKVEFSAIATPERLARGQKLAELMCAECHLDPKTGAFTGIRQTEIPEIFGKAWAQNITQDKVHGIGDWSEADIVRLLKTGLRPDGTLLLGFMLRPNLSDEDMASLVAFLKSDHEWVRPNPKQDTALEFTLLGKFVTAGMEPLEYSPKPVAMPDSAASEKLGKYLVTNLLCFGCHSNTFDMNFADIEKTENFLSGGKEMNQPNGEPIFVPNISRNKQHGIGKWSEDQFVRALRDGFNPDNHLLRPPMPRFTRLTDNEIRAIYRYIQQAPENTTPRVPGAVAAMK